MTKTTWGLATMVYMGAVAFLVLGVLVAARMGRSIRVQVPEVPGASETAEAQARAVTRGLWSAVHDARASLDSGERSDAAHALDAEMRASEVLSHAMRDDTQIFEQTLELEEVKAARRDLQMGRPDEALEAIRAAERRLQVHQLAPRNLSHAIPDPNRADDYEGAVLLNAQGVRVGEVVELRSRGGPVEEVVLAIGGAPDVLGLFDAGRAQTVTVPPEQLVFGRAKGLGSTLVMVTSVESGERLVTLLGGGQAPDSFEGAAKP